MRKTRRAATLSIVCAVLAPVALTACSSAGDDGETIAKGVKYYSEEHTSKLIQVLEVDLTVASVDVLYPGTVSDKAKPTDLAEKAGAVGVINGDFFNNSDDKNQAGYTDAPVGPMISDGEHLTAAVPDKQRMGPRRDYGATNAAALGVAGSQAQITNLDLEATATTPKGTMEIAALNQYAIPEDSVGLFTPDWGARSRHRATCGKDDNRHGGCAGDITEVIVKADKVTEVRNSIDDKPLASDEIALVARDEAHRQLNDFEEGDEITTDYQLASEDGSEFTAALGGLPLLDGNGSHLKYLDSLKVAPRTAVGYKDGGKTLYMVVVDGAGDSGGATLLSLAMYAEGLGLEHALNLDGGGSSLLAAGKDGDLDVRNNPTDPLGERAVANALAVFAEPPEDTSDEGDEAKPPEDDDASGLEGRWERRGDFPTDISTLEIEADGSVTYFAEGSPVEFTGELHEPKGNWDYTAVVRAAGEDADLVDVQEFALQLTLSDDGEELEAYGEHGVSTYKRVD